MACQGCSEKERLTVLERDMHSVIGNGRPGRLDKVETEVKSHSRMLYIGIGGLWMLQLLFGAKLFGLMKG